MRSATHPSVDFAGQKCERNKSQNTLQTQKLRNTRGLVRAAFASQLQVLMLSQCVVRIFARDIPPS